MEDAEFHAWLALTPAERFVESLSLWEVFLALGGTCDLEPDSQSPFDLLRAWDEDDPHGGAGLHPLRSGRVQP